MSHLPRVQRVLTEGSRSPRSTAATRGAVTLRRFRTTRFAHEISKPTTVLRCSDTPAARISGCLLRRSSDSRSSGSPVLSVGSSASGVSSKARRAIATSWASAATADHDTWRGPRIRATGNARTSSRPRGCGMSSSMGRQSNGRGAQNALERRGRRGEMTRWRRVSDSIGLWLDFKPDVFAGGHHVGAPARCACVDDAQSVSAAFVGTWIGLRRDR